MRISTLTTSLLIFLHFTVLSQDVTQDGIAYIETNVMKYLPFEHATHPGTKKITYEILSKNTVSTFVKRLDEMGRPISYHQLYENGRERLIQSIVYHANNHIAIETHYDKKGEIKTIKTNTWGENEKILGITIMNGKSAILNRTEFEYDPQNGYLTTIKIYQKDGEKILETWHHTYFDDKSRASSTLIAANGKIKREINYACKSEGENSDLKKNETQVCTWDESSADYLMKVYQTQDEKGQMRRNVQKLNRSDSSLVEVLSYNAAEQLTYRQTYDGSFSRPLHLMSYDKDKIVYERIRTYQNEQLSSQLIIQKGQEKMKTTYTYDSEGQILNLNTYDKNNHLIRSIKVSYDAK